MQSAPVFERDRGAEPTMSVSDDYAEMRSGPSVSPEGAPVIHIIRMRSRAS